MARLGEDAAVTIEDQPPHERASGDAARSQLAAERTLLAWWRSGLAALAVALGVGRLVPALIDAARWPFVVLGIGFATLALAFIVYGTQRQRHVDRAITEGTFRPVDDRIVLLLTALMAILAVATIALVLAAG